MLMHFFFFGGGGRVNKVSFGNVKMVNDVEILVGVVSRQGWN